MLRLSFVCALLIASISLGESPSWPQFRGTSGAGVAESSKLPLEWGPDHNVAWSVDVPGSGWSSPIVWQDRIFLTTAIPDKPEEAPKTGLYFGGERKDAPEIKYDWRVLCLSAADGKTLWSKSVKVGLPTKGKHIKNTYASETPATDGKRVYAYFAQAGVFAFTMDGEPLWKKEIGDYKTKLEWGSGSSPITDGSQVYIQCDNDEKSFMVALDAESGRENWRSERDEQTNWSTPFLWEAGGRSELVTAGKNKARSYDPATGKLLWELGGMSSIVVTTPIASDKYCFVSSGYVMDSKNRPIFAVKPGSSGDLTLKDKEESSGSVAWLQRLGGAYMPTPIVYDGVIYVLYDRGLFGCFDANTGKVIYSKKRLPNGGNYTASPWAYRSHIFCLAEDGQTHVVKAGPEFKVVGVNPPLDEKLFMATPAIAGDSLLIRGSSKLYSIRDQQAKR